MLTIMQKGTTVNENLRAIEAIKEAELFTIVQLVLGMPGENNDTIQETQKFLNTCKKLLGDVLVGANYAQSLPGTPL